MSAQTHAKDPPLREERFEVVQEDDRVAARRITLIFAAAVFITVLSVWVQSVMLQSRRADLGARHPVAPLVAPRQINGIHQTTFEEDEHGLELRKSQRATLEQWSWIDRDHGLARIPVERAMDLIVSNPSLLRAPAASASAVQAASASVHPAAGATP